MPTTQTAPAEDIMSNTTGTPETIQGKTNRHHHGIYRAHMAATDAAIAILTADPATRALAETILAAFNDLADHTAELIKLQQAQIDLLEAFCRNRDHKDELR